jgi:SSS family solute:Na+ symporter
MLATSASKDIYKRFIAPGATDAQLLKVGRGAAVAGGILGVLLAMWLDTVIGALTIFYSLLVVTLFVPIVGGLYARAARPISALASIAAGVLTLFVFSIGLFGSMTAGLDPTLTAISAAALAFGVATLATHRRDNAPHSVPQ